ncbi:MAG: hypothetical protein GF309_04380 [Candidatus Lokiarchaeota archaeon]|nr:hypothetical protein [Candidatus Lokiarchaeota archaeon]
MIRVHLYGRLRCLVDNARANENTILELEHEEGETFANLLNRLGLEKDDVGDCFLNGNLVKPSEEIPDDARIGLFPFNMRLLCGGQHLKGHGYTQSDVDVDYY